MKSEDKVGRAKVARKSVRFEQKVARKSVIFQQKVARKSVYLHRYKNITRCIIEK